jgi:hypothetical protein
MVPEWVSAQRELEGLHAATLKKREEILRSGRVLALKPNAVFEAWRKQARLDWEALAHAYNREARVFEWKAPRSAPRPPMFLIADELKRFDQMFPARR